MRHADHHRLPNRLLLLAWLWPLHAMAGDILPDGGHIVAGSGTITRNGNVMTITQGSDRLISEWQNFDIGAGARVDFLQPNSASVALNRVLGGNASQLLGTLTANGRVYLLNPSGIVFAPGAEVDVGGLVASSLDLSNSDFLAGRDYFSRNGSAGAVINQGRIDGRLVALIAPRVRNDGTIQASEGSVALAAGDAVSLDFAGDGLLKVTVDKAAVDALAENHGLIRADGGRVVMNARAAGDLMATVINNDGIIEAKGMTERDGQIVLDGGERGITANSGTLDVSSSSQGGRIVMTGDKVLVDDGARLDARGSRGGGEILVGGGWQGGDESIRAAEATVVRSGAVLDASAVDAGNGGTVVVWSNVNDPNSMTRSAGSLIVRGGSLGGDGGRIETSGHRLDVAGIHVDAVAPRGHDGGWLIDPSDITVANAGSGTLSGGVFDPSGASDSISPATILAGLAAADVTLQTSGGSGGHGDIVVADAINTSSSLGATRTLAVKADRDIIFNANTGINATTGGNTQKLNIILNSDSDGDGVGGITMTQTTLASNGGNISLGGGTAGTASGFTGGLSSVAAYALPSGIPGNVGIAIGGGTTLSAGGGNIVLKGLGKQGDGTGRAKGIEFVPDNTAGSVTVQTTGSGSITLTGQGDSAASGNFNYGIDFNNASGSINGITVSTQNGTVILSGTGGGSGASASNDGILFEGDGTTITTTGGGINLSGTAGSTSGKAIALGGNNLLGGASAGNITLTGGSFGLTGGTLQSAATLTFNATSAATVSESASIVIDADQLLLSGAGAVYNLGTGIHSVNTLAATTGGLTYVNSNALTVGTAGVTNGITATGPVSVATLSGDLTIAKNIISTDTGASAVVLNAGKSSSAGTAGGGNIIISGGATVSSGAGGRATLYTGSVSGSTGLTAMVGSGSGQFRYNSDEIATHYSIALGSGRYAVYREQPTVTVTADNQILTYGTAPTLSKTLTGLQNGDTSAQVFTTAPTVAAGGATSTSGNFIAGSHTLSAAGGVDGLGYAIAYVDGTLTVNQKPLSVTYTGVNKVYDGTTNASVTTSDDRSLGDVFTINHSEVFATNKNVGTAKTITVSGVSLSGADAANYTVAAGSSAAANITARPLAVTYTGLNKVYDGTTVAVVNTADDRVAGDTLTINRSAAFSDKNVGTGKAVTVTAVSLSGTDAGNYSVSNSGSTLANITARNLNVVYTGVNRQYDGTTNATVTTSDDRVAGDALTINRTASFAPDKNVGSGKTINVAAVSLSGADAGNYSVAATGTATADITPKVLALAATAADKIYDGNVTATVTGYGLSGFVGSETVVANSTGAVFNDKNVASGKTVTITGITLSDGSNGGLATNYTVAGTTTASAAVTPRTLNVAYTGVDKLYDGTVSAAVTTADDRVTGDAVTINRSAAFADKNVGVGKTVSVSGVSLTGSDAGNYSVAATGTTTATITAKDLTAVYSAAGKVYDGSAAATVSGASNDIVAGDQVGFSETAAFSDKNAAVGKAVNVSGIALNGTDAANYHLLNTTATATADIMPKPLSITAIVANKIYDGTTTATVQDYVLSGFVGTETVTAGAAAANFDSRFVGAGKTVTLTGVGLSDGTNGGLAGNYSVPASLTATAAITPNPYVTNVTSSLTSHATGINGTGQNASVDSAAMASGATLPGSGSETLAEADRRLFEVGTVKANATAGLTLAVDGAAAPVSFSTVGAAMTLHLGFANTNLDWPISASLPVFSLAHNTLQLQASYNIVDNGSSLALREAFSAPTTPRLGNKHGPGTLVTLSLRHDVAAQMSVHLDERGTLLITMKRGSLLSQDPRTVVLLGLAAAKARLGASLYDVRAVVVER